MDAYVQVLTAAGSGSESLTGGHENMIYFAVVVHLLLVLRLMEEPWLDLGIS